MTARPTAFLGSYVVGEVPPSLVYQYLDADGVPINLTGYGTVTFRWGSSDRGMLTNPTTATGTLGDALTGQVVYAWTGAEFATPGPFAGTFTVGDGTHLLTSVLLTWQVCR